MKQGHAFPAARPVARHCPELIRRAAPREQSGERFAEVAGDLARAFAERLGGLLGGVRLRASCTPLEELTGSQIATRSGDLAACSALAFPGSGAQAIASIPLRDLLALTDRVFGGEGAVPEELPAELPLTADLVAGQVEALLAESFAQALAMPAPPEVDGRAGELGRLAHFAAAGQWRSFTLEVSEPGAGQWTILLAFSPQSFASLFASANAGLAATASAHHPHAGPFADLPLELEAVVAEFTLPLSRLSDLKPGDTLPLALCREVPLKISETTIAYGSVGTADERVALQLTRVL